MTYVSLGSGAGLNALRCCAGSHCRHTCVNARTTIGMSQGDKSEGWEREMIESIETQNLDVLLYGTLYALDSLKICIFDVGSFLDIAQTLQRYFAFDVYNMFQLSRSLQSMPFDLMFLCQLKPNI